MKKILMVCEAFGGGVFTYVSQLCNDMADDFDIYLAYSLRPQTPKEYKEFIDPRVHLIQVNSWKGQSIFNLCSDFKSIRELRKIEREISPDIIHLHSSVAGGIGRLAFRRKTVVYTPHGYAHILLPPCFKSKIYGVLEWILGKGKCITLTCCDSEDKVAKSLCQRTAYIETGINIKGLKSILERIEPEKKDTFTVYTMGRICAQKNPSLFNEIAQLVPEAHFVWIGNGELEKELTDVEVTGWLPRNAALALAKSADAFILCSRGEAIAMSLIENMFMGKLVLVSNVMGNKSVVRNGENGYICAEAKEYAERIKTAIKHYPTTLSARAIQDVIDIYNSEIMKKKYLIFYNNLLEV